MRPPRSALASTGSTAGGACLRASQVSAAPRMSPPSIGAPKAARGATRAAALRWTSKGMPKIKTCATLTTLVITATHKPASTPTTVASAAMPNSFARRRARTVASATSAGRGTEIIRARRSTEPPMIELMRGGAGHAKGGGDPPAPSSPAGERHVVAVDHFSAPGRSEDVRDVARISSPDALGVAGVIGDEPAPDFSPALVADGDAIAARETAFDPRDPGRQQALSPRQRRGGSGIDEHCALELERSADPELARRHRVRRGQEPGAAAAFGDAHDRMGDAPVRNHHMRAGGRGDAGG